MSAIASRGTTARTRTSLLRFIDTNLRGAGQVMFQGNALHRAAVPGRDRLGRDRR